MAEPATLTLDDIRDIPELMELGALPGDQVSGNNLIRKFSSEEDRIDLGVKLTDEDIQAIPELAQKGAVAGDRIVGNTVMPAGAESSLQQFMYGFDESRSFTGYVSDALEAALPLGRFDIGFQTGFKYYSPEEIYGAGFTEADWNDRMQMIARAREREVLEEYGPYFEPQGGAAQTIGEVAGVLADPTTLIPVGAGIKGAAAVGAGLGAGYSALEDIAQTGEVDLEKAAITGAIGGTGAAVLPIAGKAVSALRRKAPQLVTEGDVKFNKAAEDAFNDAVVNDSAFSRVAGPAAKAVDKYLGVLSTQVGNISQPILRRMRKFEADVHLKTKERLEQAEPFMRNFAALGKNEKGAIAKHLYNGNFEAAEGLMKSQRSRLAESFEPVKKMLGVFKEEYKDSGLDFIGKQNYFPRIVKDYEGLLKSLGGEQRSAIDKMQREFAKKKGIQVDQISEDVKKEIANKALRGYGLKDAPLPGNVKKRTIQEINDGQLRYYASPEESLHMYIRNAVNNIERRNFFGRGVDDVMRNVDGTIDVEGSIGRVVQREIDAGRLDIANQDKLKELISARFIGGEQSSSQGIGILRDLGYMGTIANPISAITQLGDLGVSGALYGFRNTIASMFGAKNIKLVDLGLSDISKEVAEVRPTAKLLDKMFRVSLFKRVDRLGKETAINASLRKNINMVKTAKGEAAFRKKWGKFYEGEIDALVADLKNKQISDIVKFHAFNELSDVQPITMLELPQGYNMYKNGRILYALKSFTLKQLDVVRRNVVQEYAKGSKTQAIKQAALLAGYLSTANVATQTVKDLLLGRDVEVDDIPNNALWALLGVYGGNKYITDKYISKGQITDAAKDLIMPATPILDAVFEGGAELAGEDPDIAKYTRSIPVVGPLVYNWFLGGAEKYNERLAKER